MKYIVTLIILLALCLNSCKVPYYVQVGTTDSTIIIKRDSIIFDTVQISIPGEEKTAITTIERIRVEPRIIEVEKPLTKWQNFKMNVGGWAMIAIVALIIFYILKLLRKLKII